ncbi:MAG: hypothetical protein Q8O89_01340 [Nanoarchaeota archaeon]|nr:hypothetical protein [Nanoarchaeota archaeon]
MNTKLQEWTERTIDFLLDENQTDFTSFRIEEKATHSSFNNKVKRYLGESEDFVMLDIGGGSGTRIALPVTYIAQKSSVYIIDPNANEEHAEPWNMIKAHFSDLSFLPPHEKNKPKAFINFRTNLDVTYKVIDAALKENTFFVGLEPLFYSLYKNSLPAGIIKFNGKLENLELSKFYEGKIIPKTVNKLSAIKQLFVLDFASVLAENNFSVKIYSKDDAQISVPDSEHFIMAYKELQPSNYSKSGGK